VCFHRSGTGQEEDTRVFVPETNAIWPAVSLSTDDRYLIVSLSRGLGPGAELRALELARPGSGFHVLLPAGAAEQTVVATQDEVFYVLTDHTADRRKIIAVPAVGSTHGQCDDVVPECPDTLLEAHFFGGRVAELGEECGYLVYPCEWLQGRSSAKPI
jgi:protease II